MTNRRAYAIAAAILATSTASGIYLAARGRFPGTGFSPWSAQARAETIPAHPNAESKDGGVVVELCDGVTRLEIPGLKPGEHMSRAQAQTVARKLMAEWESKHPGQHWQLAQAPAEPHDETSPAGAPPAVPEESASPQAPAAAPTSAQKQKNEQGAEEKKQQTQTEAAAGGPGRKSPPGPGKKGAFKIQQGDTYASFNQRDYMLWKAETDKFVQKGKEIFHDANQLGSTIGISCDMCHPDGSNTHPETYPKYQVQLQRVALLRDMIDWCIENPIKGKTMSPDDERLRALEAYILAQRKGVALDYGKH